MVGLATDDMVVRTQQHQQPSPNRHLGGGQSEFPVFIPPRKRQTGKKTNHGNHIDHIVNIQGTRKEWDLTPEREDCRRNKRWNSEEIIEISSTGKGGPIANGTNEDEDDLNELQHFHPLKDSSTVTPSSISESSLDRKSSKSAELLTGGKLEQISKQALAVHGESSRSEQSCCTLRTGVHILLLSLVCLPFVTLTTGIYSFYMGTVTWYNMFTYFNEERSYCHKLLMSPLLILAYPLGIVLCTVGLALYAGIRQISFHFRAWLNEIADIEKGFYGWLCSFLHLSDCSPYEVVILTDICPANPAPGGTADRSTDGSIPTGVRVHPSDGRLQGESTQINSSTEELSV
uniref:Transmembrane protein 169 n=1 Tax=Anopheles coluzzii TaxID=1518534 RepID=A0A8W7PUL5_ANOCL